MIDLLEQDLPSRTAAYVIRDTQVALIETGSAMSQTALLAGLTESGLSPEDLDYIIVTHVHLDHAGGAGQLMQLAKKAKLVCHPRGARHMANPSKLWAGASDVYGLRVSELFGGVEPVPAERILVREDGDTLVLGDRTLTFFDSPGHAKHHFTILDPDADALYAGDAVGIRYRLAFTGLDFEWVMPSTSPVDFNPKAVETTLNRLRTLPFQTVYHTHFGASPKDEAINSTLQGALDMAKLIEHLYQPDLTWEPVAGALRTWIRQQLSSQGFVVDSDLSVLDIDVVLDAMGLLVYERRRRSQLMP